MDLYAENILDHYRHPRQKQSLPKPTVRHREENLSCGDELTLDLLIEDGSVKDVGWMGEGCAISQAAMSMLSEELPGKTIRELTATTPDLVYKFLGVPIGPRRFKCALLCLHTLKNALRISEGKNPQSWTETVALGEN